MKRTPHIIFAALLILCVLTGCSRPERTNTLMVSVEPQRALLEQIVGDRFEVVTVLTPGSNPETYEPDMATRRRLETSRAFFATGHLPFEEKLSEAGDGVTVVNTSVGITPVYGTHDHNHGHGHGHKHEHNADPHVWTSVRNARVMARTMYDSVVALDPANMDYFTERYKALDAHLDSLDHAFGKRLSGSTNRTFAIWHPSLSYLARDYGLNQLSVGFENKEMPAGALKAVIDKARAAGVNIFFFQKEFDDRQAQTLNKEMGTTLVTINPLAYDWEEQLDSVVSALCR